jgi:hypothetical protein
MAGRLNSTSGRTIIGFITVLVWTWIINLFLMWSVSAPENIDFDTVHDPESKPVRMDTTVDLSDSESQNWIPASEPDTEACRFIDAAARLSGAVESDEAELWKHLDCVHRIETFYGQWCVYSMSNDAYLLQRIFTSNAPPPSAALIHDNLEGAGSMPAGTPSSPARNSTTRSGRSRKTWCQSKHRRPRSPPPTHKPTTNYT